MVAFDCRRKCRFRNGMRAKSEANSTASTRTNSHFVREIMVISTTQKKEHPAQGFGTISVNGGTNACSAVIAPTTQARKALCHTTALKMSASLPI